MRKVTIEKGIVAKQYGNDANYELRTTIRMQVELEGHLGVGSTVMLAGESWEVVDINE